jgi:hypothetical protein
VRVHCLAFVALVHLAATGSRKRAERHRRAGPAPSINGDTHLWPSALQRYPRPSEALSRSEWPFSTAQAGAQRARADAAVEVLVDAGPDRLA